MARILVKVKNLFFLPKNIEPAFSSASSGDASCDPGPRPAVAATPPYHHAAAVQPPLQAPTASPSPAPPTFQQRARQIARFQVCGTRRTIGGSSCTPSSCGDSTYTRPSGTSSRSGWTRPSCGTADQTTISTYTSDSDAALVSAEKRADMHAAPGHCQPARSTWQGKPNGTAYDRREELTEEDEDTWARLAM